MFDALLEKLGIRAVNSGAAGVWQAAVPVGERYALCGCTVAPGFDFADFELPSRAALVERFPAVRELVERLTR